MNRYTITESEKERILGMHKTANLRHHLNEQDMSALEMGTVEIVDSNRIKTLVGFYKTKVSTIDGKPVVIGTAPQAKEAQGCFLQGFCNTGNKTAKLKCPTYTKDVTVNPTTIKIGDWERFCNK